MSQNLSEILGQHILQHEEVARIVVTLVRVDGSSETFSVAAPQHTEPETGMPARVEKLKKARKK